MEKLDINNLHKKYDININDDMYDLIMENRLKINELVGEVNELVGYVNGLIDDVKQLRAWVNQREQDDRDMGETMRTKHHGKLTGAVKEGMEP